MSKEFKTLIFLFGLLIIASCNGNDGFDFFAEKEQLIIRNWILVGGKFKIPVLEVDTIMHENDFTINQVPFIDSGTKINRAILDSFLLNSGDTLQNDRKYWIQNRSKCNCFSANNINIYELYLYDKDDEMFGLTIYYSTQEGPLLFLMGQGIYKYLASKTIINGDEFYKNKSYTECISHLFRNEDKLIYYQ